MSATIASPHPARILNTVLDLFSRPPCFPRRTLARSCRVGVGPAWAVVAGLLWAAPALPETLSRAEVVARALKANPDVSQSLEDQALFEARKREARADALPELKLIGTATRYRDPALLNSSSFDSFPESLRNSLVPTPANLFEARAELRQTLFSFKVGRALRAARLATRLSSEQLRRTRQAVALEAVQTYNGFLLALEKVAVARKLVVLKQKHLEMARNRRQAGVATDLDVLRSEVDLENTRALLRRLRGAADLARGVLNAAMLRPIEAPVEPSDSLTHAPLEVTLEDVVAEALEQRPELRASELSGRLLDELMAVERAETRPSLEFFGTWGYSVREPGNFLKRDFTRWNAGITLVVPLFDGFRADARVAQARAERNKLSHADVALRNQIRLEAKDAVNQLHVAAGILKAAKLNVVQADRAAVMTQANYRYGAATTLDVLDAQAALTQAESTRLQSLYDHANARAAVRFVMARDPLDVSAVRRGEDRPGGGAPRPATGVSAGSFEGSP